MNDWYCRKCGQEVMSDGKPEPMKWSDGHVCYFIPGLPPEGAEFEI